MTLNGSRQLHRQPMHRGGPPSATGAPADQLWEHLRTAIRHRWWALAGAVLLGVPMVAITALTTPVYRSTATLLLAEESAPTAGLVDADRSPGNQPAVDPQTQTEVLRSRALARDVIQVMRLWEHPAYGPLVSGITDTEQRNQSLIDPFLSMVSVGLVPESRVLAVSAESPDAALASRVANTVAERYIERDRSSRFAAAEATSEWLTKRLAEQRLQVSQAETALQTYRATQDALSLSDRQNIVGQKLIDLNTAVTKAKTDRILYETQFRQIEAIKGDPAAIESHPLVATNAFIQTLKAQAAELSRQEAQLSDRLGPKHPERVQVATALASVQERLRLETGKIVEGIGAGYRSTVAQESGLTQALNSQKSEAFALDKKSVEYSTLEREAASARQLYDTLLQQTKEASLVSDQQRSPVRLIDPAEPGGAPVRPRKAQGYAAAVMLGILGAFGGGFGREYLRRKVASPADVEKRLGLPVLTLLPETGLEEATEIGGLSPLPAEAIRKLRAGVMIACGDATTGVVLVVTSAAPGEGKSFVSAHLAASLAAADQRVVLIDADLRRPRLHEMFDRQRRPGLSDLLLARRTSSEVLRPVGQLGLVLIPSGSPTTQASELLSLQGSRKLFDELRTDFDWIVIDSPPVMAVADATLVARDADAVLFVTSADRTSLEAAGAALEELDAAGARMLGAVLNRAPLGREAFYYSRYYRPEYASYLGTDGAGDAPTEASAPTS